MITEGPKLIWYRAKSTANSVCKIYTMEQPHMTKGNTEANQLVWPILKEFIQLVLALTRQPPHHQKATLQRS
jgi:hypothetical protein